MQAQYNRERITNPALTNILKALAQEKTTLRVELTSAWTPQDIRILTRVLRTNTNLTTVTLRGSKTVSDKVFAVLVDTLQTHPTLTNLTLRHPPTTAMGKKTLSALSNLIRHSPALTHLTLRENKLNDADIKQLSKVLPKSRLQHLDLGNNFITDKGVNHLTGALKKNTTLTSLHVHSNQIKKKGAVQLAKFSNQKPTLLDLNLAYNPVSPEGTREVMGLLQRNTHLQSLNLDNLVMEDSLYSLMDLVQNNRTLTELSARHNDFTVEDRQQLKNAFDANPILESLALVLDKNEAFTKQAPEEQAEQLVAAKPLPSVKQATTQGFFGGCMGNRNRKPPASPSEQPPSPSSQRHHASAQQAWSEAEIAHSKSHFFKPTKVTPTPPSPHQTPLKNSSSTSSLRG